MRLSFIQNDFRFCLESRQTALHEFLAEQCVELNVVELADK